MAFNKISLLERLKTGPVVGDGSMVVLLEKRGYCTPGIWTPEAVMLYPEAVREILREYIHAGADVITTPCFYSSDARLRRGNKTFTVSLFMLCIIAVRRSLFECYSHAFHEMYTCSNHER